MKAIHLLCLVSLADAACIRAPSVVIVDHKTALEQQAAGQYRPLEAELTDVLTQPRAVPLTAGELADVRDRASAVADVGGATTTEELARSHRARIDDWLIRKCVGEALNGTLVETPASCVGDVDWKSVARTLERSNRNRAQVWEFLQRKTRERSIDDVRAAWRAQHLTSVICGGQIQRSDASWEPKSC